MSVSEELAKLAQLRDQGVLTQAEFDVQKAAVLRGAPTSEAPPKKRRPGIGCAIIIGVLVLLMIIGLATGGSKTSTAPAATDATSAPEPVKVTAGELNAAYAANEAAAQAKFGDRPIEISGKVDAIELDLTNDPVIRFGAPGAMIGAQASLADADKPKAASIAKGQSVTLLCASVTEVVGTPMLRECAVQ